MYQNEGMFFLCGDFNSRIANEPDFIEGVDEVPERETVDYTHNAYGNKMIDFLLSSNCCVLNGRKGVCIQNDFTSISTKGLAVLDYCLVPYEALPYFTDFKVLRARQLFNDTGCMSYVDPSHTLPDHSLLTWKYTCGLYTATANDQIDNEPISFTKWSRNVPNDFLLSDDMINRVNDMIAQIEANEKSQKHIDNVYDSFCGAVKEEMCEKVDNKTVLIKPDQNGRKRRMKKPWWSEVLSEKWNVLCEAERKWKRASGVRKVALKADMRSSEKAFDKEVQGAKRRYWRRNQEELMQLNSTDPREFWKRIGKIGVAADRKPNIPWEIEEDGLVKRDRDSVLNKWKCDFSDLLNYDVPCGEPGQSINTDNHSNIPTPLIDTGLDNPITMEEVRKCVIKAKMGKAVGCDELPAEVLDNETARQFLYSLFHTCYETGIVPSLWLKGIINPLPKDNTLDPRDPMNYRGITLACSMYKLYCYILNARLVTWSETNGLVDDAQNGFRTNRSCVDQISSLTSIIETRKAMKKSTFTLFVDFSKAFDRINRQFLWDKLSRMGLRGKMMTALHGIYSNVQCCVRINSVTTQYFNVSSGLKQGCLISPILFNLFINDLILELKESGCGIDIGAEELICVLCYADDLVFIADNAEELQTMLNVLKKWCERWAMDINTKKTQVVHFRPTSLPKTDTVFTFGDVPLAIAEKYKYLGLILTEHLDYDKTAALVAKSAGRALGLMIAKAKAYGGLPYDCYTKLFNSLVQPIIDYGAAVWGTKEFSCINAVQNRACRFFMGVGRYTPNAATQGDMGWCCQNQKQWLCVTRQWCRFMNMDQSRINKQIFCWTNQKAGPHNKNWCSRVHVFYRKLSMHHLLNTNSDFNTDSVIKDMSDVLSEHYEVEWYAKVSQNAARNGNGQNKLRTYKLFKKELQCEIYLKSIFNYKHRSAFAKFRCGVAPIRLETGRYEQLNVQDRICPLCNSEVESEEHVLTRCQAHTVFRNDLYNHACNINPNFNDFSDCDKLIFILSNPDICRISAKTCYTILCHRRDLLYSN